MIAVWASLGYDRVARAVAETLRDGSDVAVIQGPPGIGKSWLAKGIGALWEADGGAAVVAEGDRLHGDDAFYALGFAMASLTAGWRAAVKPVLEVARAGESLVGTRGIIANTIEVLARVRPRERRARSMLLSDPEREILFEVEHIARERPLLLIADNLHWWDGASLAFLSQIRNPSMWAMFPFLANVRVLAARTPEPFQTEANPAHVEALLSPSATRYFPLGRIPRNRFSAILEGLGATEEPSPSVVDTIYRLTGGHLTLARRCVVRLNEGAAEVFLSRMDTEEFIPRLLGERIRDLGTLGREAVELLQVAALLGLRFRRDEVACAWGADSKQTSAVLRLLRDQEFVELTESTGTFVHELYREHVLTMTDFDRIRIHERLSDCLRLLSPGEYELRCQNAIQAERPTEAATLAVQAALACLRNRQPWTEMSSITLGVLEDSDDLDVVGTLQKAMEHVESDRYADSLAALDSLPRTMAEALLAESDYIRADCLMQTRSDEDRQHARSILANWNGYEAEEPELGMRLMLEHLFGLTMVADPVPGHTLENEIRKVLRPRLALDKTAEDANYTLDRCAPSLYHSDAALLKVQDAVTYFRPPRGRVVVRRPLEFFKALVNLAAEQVVNARYQDALSTSGEIEELVDQFAPDTFPRLDFHRGTALLAEFRLGRVGTREAVVRQEHIIASHDVEGDPFYPYNALSMYLALDGRFQESIDILDRLLQRIETYSDPEPSMLYLLRSNHCAVRFVAGDRIGLAEEWRLLDPVAERIPYPTRRFTIRRHELLGNVIREDGIFEPSEFDECLLKSKRSELGPMWDQLGRAFRLPEVEWWH